MSGNDGDDGGVIGTVTTEDPQGSGKKITEEIRASSFDWDAFARRDIQRMEEELARTANPSPMVTERVVTTVQRPLTEDDMGSFHRYGIAEAFPEDEMTWEPEGEDPASAVRRMRRAWAAIHEVHRNNGLGTLVERDFRESDRLGGMRAALELVDEGKRKELEKKLKEGGFPVRTVPKEKEDGDGE